MRHDVPHQLMPISHNQEETEMDATTVAVDLAKSVFELAIANTRWRVVVAPATQPRTVRPLSRADAADPCGDGGVWHRPLLGAGCPATRPSRHPRAPGVRAALRAAQQDGPGGCGGDPVGRDTPCPGEAGRAASARGAAPGARAVDDDADGAHQCVTRALAGTGAAAAGGGLCGAAGLACAARRGGHRVAEASAAGAHERPRGSAGD